MKRRGDGYALFHMPGTCTEKLSFAAPRRVEVVPVELRAPGDDEVLIRTLYSGVSPGTELLAYRGEVDPDTPLDDTLGALGGTFRFPFAYGYSCVGVVEHGTDAVPASARVFAFHPHQRHAVVPDRDVVVLERADATATLFPLVETALQVTLDADVRLGELAVVAGLGAVGTLVAALLARSGAEVVGVEPTPARRAMAASFGIATCAPDEAADVVTRRSAGRGADVAVEATGRPDALAGLLPLLRTEGTVVVCSWYGTNAVALPLGREFHRRRLRIASTQVSTIPAALSAGWDRARRLALTRRLVDELPLERLGTRVFPLHEAPAVYAALDGGDPTLVHAAFRYEDEEIDG